MAGVITPFAGEQRGAKQHQERERAGTVAVAAWHQRQQRENTPLAVVVGAQHEKQILDAHHHEQRPEDQRKNAEHVFGGDRYVVRAGRAKALFDGVERAGADVAVDHAERREHERKAG